jgi:hypothetical protein
MRGARPQGVPANELRPPNLYYDHSNARQIFHPPADLQTTNGYIPIQGRQAGPPNVNSGRQAPPTDPGPSNFQDVRFMDGVLEAICDDMLPLPHLAIGYLLRGESQMHGRRVDHPPMSLKVQGIESLSFAYVECEGLTLVTLGRIE